MVACDKSASRQLWTSAWMCLGFNWVADFNCRKPSASIWFADWISTFCLAAIVPKEPSRFCWQIIFTLNAKSFTSYSSWSALKIIGVFSVFDQTDVKHQSVPLQGHRSVLLNWQCLIGVASNTGVALNWSELRLWLFHGFCLQKLSKKTLNWCKTEPPQRGVLSRRAQGISLKSLAKPRLLLWETFALYSVASPLVWSWAAHDRRPCFTCSGSVARFRGVFPAFFD